MLHRMLKQLSVSKLSDRVRHIRRNIDGKRGHLF